MLVVTEPVGTDYIGNIWTYVTLKTLSAWYKHMSNDSIRLLNKKLLEGTFFISKSNKENLQSMQYVFTGPERSFKSYKNTPFIKILPIRFLLTDSFSSCHAFITSTWLLCRLTRGTYRYIQHLECVADVELLIAACVKIQQCQSSSDQ